MNILTANDLIKLQSDLTDVIDKWLTETDTYALDCYLGSHTAELMASSAFNVLLAQKDLTDYLQRDGLLKD